MNYIAYTPGEPAGIGPDIILQLAQTQTLFSVVVIADRNLLIERAKQLNLPINIVNFEENLPHTATANLPTLLVKHVELNTKSIAGKLNVKNVSYTLNTLQFAAQSCLKGLFSSIVTGPVHKGIINDAGIVFTGQTEYLANITGGQPVMMLATDNLRVALATTHLPLAQVPKTITKKLLTQTLTILHHDLQQRFGIAQPRILVCGLNPHAGENGHLGREEIEVITPALIELRTKGLELIGPLSADTVFTKQHLAHADAVLAMYHDQGLPVLKYQGFGHAINITLGLPIIRTSVDHGTALELAGIGKADIGSLQAALKMAIELTK